jgi:two-component system, OmpR family, KDP operon response regulator KdpE
VSAERRPDILVAGGDAELRRRVGDALDQAGFGVREVADGRTALGEIAVRRPDGVILELQLPDLGGPEMLRALRPICDAPVLVVSSLASEEDKVAALDGGADDYLTRPFGTAELVARLRALLRRSGAGVRDRCVRLGPVEIDLARRWVGRDGRQIRLTATEFELLRLLVAHRDQVVSHRKILRELWGPAAEDRIHYVRTYMARLRGKLGEDLDAAGYLQSESGVGYRLVSRPEVLERA